MDSKASILSRAESLDAQLVGPDPAREEVADPARGDFTRPAGDGNLSCLIECYGSVEVKVLTLGSHDEGLSCVKGVI